jgi:deoxyribodipyrimidine photo-lyase
MAQQYNKVVFWFRNDLRLADNVALYQALSQSETVVPVFVFDTQQFRSVDLGIKGFSMPKTGAHRAKFLMETVADLRDNIRAIGGDLVIRTGKPQEAVMELVRQTGADAVFASEEVTYEEVKVDRALEDKLKEEGKELLLFWQMTLLHVDDIPFSMEELPDVFTQFRKKSEKFAEPRPTVNAPTLMPSLPEGIDAGVLPSYSALGVSEPEYDSRSVLQYKGGETAGMERVMEYIWDHDCLKEYKKTRNGMMGADFSSKFSAWLSNGSLSPRSVYEQVKQYEAEREKNSSTYWLIFELLWRDYFRYVALKYEDKIFHLEGTQGKPVFLKEDVAKFERWIEGSTGVPYIDANMRELNKSGYMSNRGRQNVASFLVKDLEINWTWGAAYFESLLIDYDVCSNWCNWNYTAGVGNDPREDRYFNIISQGTRYDDSGEYVRHWIPELGDINGKKVHFAPELDEHVLQNAGVKLGDTYPKPMVNIAKWMKKEDQNKFKR